MKIVFDAYWWSAGPPSLRHVLREILFAWSEVFPADDLVLVTRHGSRPDLDQLGANTVVVPTRLWPQALSARFAVSAAAKAHRADAVVTHNFSARVRRAVSTVYLHDVLFATNPEWFTMKERAYFHYMLRWITSSDVVFTSTSEEARRIRENSRAREVVPVGLGLSTELASGEDESIDQRLTPGKFLLTVGRLNARKNLEQTIRSAIASGVLAPETPLVIVGAPDGLSVDLTGALEEAAGAVIFTGFVDEDRLRWLYRNCALFIYLSLGEGFGMPPVEAAHFGAPVVVSDLPVFRETLPDNVVFVDPSDRAACAAVMREALLTGRPDRGSGDASVAERHDWKKTVTAMRSSMEHIRMAVSS